MTNMMTKKKRLNQLILRKVVRKSALKMLVNLLNGFLMMFQMNAVSVKVSLIYLGGDITAGVVEILYAIIVPITMSM
jgi:hypothetical protein